MLTMRSFMIGTLLVATVWANEEPTSPVSYTHLTLPTKRIV